MRRGGLCWKDEEFSVGYVEFETAMGHPSRNIRQAVGSSELDKRGEFWHKEIECFGSLIWVWIEFDNSD